MIFLTILAFIIILGLLVFVHEFGHYISAKISGVKVEEFAFGFPPRLFGFQLKREKKSKEVTKHEEIKIEIEDVNRAGKEEIKETITDTVETAEKEKSRLRWRFAWGHRALSRFVAQGSESNLTTYLINLIPFGGYVRMLGEEEASSDKRSFSAKRPKYRLFITVAGVIMNFILAGALLSAGYMIGMSPIRLDPVKLGGKQHFEVLVAQVIADSPAMRSGISLGDAIVGFASSEDFSNFTHGNLGKEVNFSVRHEGKTSTKSVTLSDNAESPLGVGVVSVPTVRLSFFSAIYNGFKEMVYTTGYVVLLIKDIFVGIFKEHKVTAEVAGPVGIFNLTGQAVKLGLVYLIQLAAILSINLGLINILPFPALDGGRAVVILSEAIFGRRIVKAEVENILHTIGFVILIALIVAVTAKELFALF